MSERFSPREATISHPLTETERKPVWRVAKKIKEVAALSALLSFLSPMGEAVAEPAGETKEKPKIEELQRQARESLQTIVTGMKSNKGWWGVAGETGTEPACRWQSSKKDLIEVGFDNQKDKPLWVIEENAEANLRYIDSNADGSLDRIIFNKRETPPSQKQAENYLYSIGTMEMLATDANLSANFKKEKIQIYELTKEGGAPIILVVDFTTGESTKLTGEKVDALTAKVQGLFTDKITQLAGEIQE